MPPEVFRKGYKVTYPMVYNSQQFTWTCNTADITGYNEYDPVFTKRS